MYGSKTQRWVKAMVVSVFLSAANAAAEYTTPSPTPDMSNTSYSAPSTDQMDSAAASPAPSASPSLNNPTTGKPATDLSNYGSLQAGVMQQARNAQDAGGGPGQIASDTNQSDHAKNNGQSGDKSGDGSAAAATAGGIMIGTGTTMLASPIIPVQVAGANLIAMGITELAQSAASSGTQKDNYNNKATLKMSDGDTGSQSTGSNQPGGSHTAVDPASALTPEAKQVLQDHNIDPNDFANKAMNNQLGSERDIANAFGIKDATDEQMQEAKGMVDAKVGNVLEKTSLTLDESTKNKQAADPSATTDASGPINQAAANGQPGNHSTSASLSGNLPGSSSTNGGFVADTGARQNATPVPPTVPLDSPAWNSVLNQVGVGGDAAPWEKKALAEDRLGKIGVELPRKGLNIFQKASLRYVKFATWRKAKSVAAR